MFLLPNIHKGAFVRQQFHGKTEVLCKSVHPNFGAKIFCSKFWKNPKFWEFWGLRGRERTCEFFHWKFLLSILSPSLHPKKLWIPRVWDVADKYTVDSTSCEIHGCFQICLKAKHLKKIMFYVIFIDYIAVLNLKHPTFQTLTKI